MKRKLFSNQAPKLIILLFLCSIVQSIAQTVNETATITWPFNTGVAGQTATYSGSASTATYFKPDYVTLGSNYIYNGAKAEATIAGSMYTSIKNPGTSNTPTGVAVGNLLSFNVTPVTGLNFTPTSIAFNCQRFGTGSGVLDLYWKSSNGTSTLIQANVKPARSGVTSGGDFNYYIKDLTALSIPSSNGLCTLEIYIHTLGGGKDVGISNVQIIGNLSGTIAAITTYTVSTTNSPANGGNITSFPVGTTHDSGTEVTLTATRNFGYQFSHWANDLDQIVSTSNPYTFTLNNNVNLKAVYTAINTYSLEISVNGGAKDYMVGVSPAGTMVGGIRMYEEGTNVSLTANNNPILNFSNWGTGETNSILNVAMNSNKSISANYNASEYVVGWDFYKTGNNSRVADFSSDAINDPAALILRKADGTQAGWLGKSVLEGGYEGRGAAVNWQPIANQYYYQIKINATDYTNISVKAAMLFNYNAYTKQLCEYSLDGINFTGIGVFDLVNAKQYYENTFTLPADANNKSEVYIRWIPDYTSTIVGAAATNDGTTISGIYVFGTKSVFNDGIAPVVVSSIPANNATGASATGKVVLNFDERIKIVSGTTATLNGKNLTPEVFGKSISFNYSGLSYNTTYTFTLAGNKISDLADNTLTTPISVTFTTLNKPVVTKKAYNFIVGVDGNFAAALAAAQTASASGERFYIFFPNGNYDLGNTTGDATQQTFINLPNVSFIGQSADGVTLFNEPLAANEGIGTTPTINFQSNSKNIYMQDLTILNKMDYRKGAFTGRAVALRDQGDRNIYKNVKLLSNQDTFYTASNRIYLENSEIHGTVDFIFGGGDVFFNACTLYLEDRAGNHVTAAATGSNWGYVFRDCTIDGFAQNNGSYKLGRPWQGSPKVVFINTVMKQLPANEGWSEWGALPSVYAEYNSLTGSGNAIDLSGRRTTYSNGSGGSVTLNPVLTQAQANNYTIENVLSGTDTWQPTLATEQASIPVLSNTGKILNWANNNYVLGWAIFKNDVFVSFTTTNSYDASAQTSGKFSVRAANEMGGLSAKSNELDVATLGLSNTNLVLNTITVSPNPTSGIAKIQIGGSSQETNLSLYTLLGKKLWSNKLTTGNNESVTIDLSSHTNGVYILKVERESESKTVKIIKQ